MTIAPRADDRNPEARDQLFSVAPRMTAPADRHWYHDDSEARGYCLACGLPRQNRRHVERREAAA